MYSSDRPSLDFRIKYFLCPLPNMVRAEPIVWRRARDIFSDMTRVLGLES